MATVKKTVYLDNAASTPVDPAVFKAMQPFFSTYYGNASSLYPLGRESNGAINDARRTVANVLGTQPDTIMFTSGGTESANLAIFGAAEALETKGKHIITTTVEHHAVLHAVEKLEKRGWKITYLPVDSLGRVNPDHVVKALTPETVLVSVMYANNEIGTVEPVAEIGRKILQYRKQYNTALPYFHSDACQAAGDLDLHVEKLHVDLLTLNGSKMYGPKGTGVLYVRRGTKIEPQILGGSQENGLRAGTENIPGIVGFARALDIADKMIKTEPKRLKNVSAYFIKQIKKVFPDFKLNGPEIGDDRLSNNVNVYFPGIDGEALVIYLGGQGVMCSTGSACTAESIDPSHVLLGIGCSKEHIKNSVRFTLGRYTKKTDIDYTIMVIKKVLPLLSGV